jgi:FdhD protein
VAEEPLEVRLNGHTVAVLLRTPGQEKELAAGFCLGEGLVSAMADVALVHHCGRAAQVLLESGDALDESRNRVDVLLAPGRTAGAAEDGVVRTIRSGCGRADVSMLAGQLQAVDSGTRVGYAVLGLLSARLAGRQAAYRAAGGVHAAGVFDVFGRDVVVCEDIGRHNAVDKALGHCLLRGIPLHDKVVVSTGRASYDMVVKGVRLGVPILASLSSPTSLAVELAHALNCTLLGYLRGRALNVYSHGWRILTEEV